MSALYEKFFNEPLGDKKLFDETYPYHHTMFAAIAAHNPELALTEFHKLMNCIENIIRTY
jgi:GntR family transcriptional repressor for pyruvate dehydrogenase complex